MGSSASIEQDITVIDVERENVVTKLRNINPKKLTLADCRNKLKAELASFYFVDEIGVKVLEIDELILVTKVIPKNTYNLYVKIVDSINETGTLSNTTANTTNIINPPPIDEIRNASSTNYTCLLYTSPSPRDGLLSRMPSSA